jgi:abequosyltransferase
MSETSLSICIPTYNFGRFIGETLASIAAQLPGELAGIVEVVVVDGASTDNTAEVVRGYQEKCPAIRYVRLDARGGIDRDMARSVELAHGRYCWLFSSDDVMRAGAVATILGKIRSGHDVYLCKHTDCTFDMKVMGVRPVLAAPSAGTFNLGNAPERRRYCELAQTTEAFFSFMGGLIVNRARWLSIPLDEAFVGSCWAHVARLFALVRPGLVVGWVPDVLLDQRGDNDSFADRGIVDRFRIAIDGYHRLAAAFFGDDSPEAYHIRRVLRNEFRFRTFLAATVRSRRNPHIEDARVLDELIRKTYRDIPLTARLISLGCSIFPSRLYPGLQGLYHRLIARFRAAR